MCKLKLEVTPCSLAQPSCDLCMSCDFDLRTAATDLVRKKGYLLDLALKSDRADQEHRAHCWVHLFALIGKIEPGRSTAVRSSSKGSSDRRYHQRPETSCQPVYSRASSCNLSSFSSASRPHAAITIKVWRRQGGQEKRKKVQKQQIWMSGKTTDRLYHVTEEEAKKTTKKSVSCLRTKLALVVRGCSYVQGADGRNVPYAQCKCLDLF